MVSSLSTLSVEFKNHIERFVDLDKHDAALGARMLMHIVLLQLIRHRIPAGCDGRHNGVGRDLIGNCVKSDVTSCVCSGFIGMSAASYTTDMAFLMQRLPARGAVLTDIA